MRPVLALCAFVLLFGAGCTIPWVENPAPKEPLDKQAKLYPSQEYKIQYGDQLDIKFLYNPELNENLPVRPDGRITLQIVGDIMVVDMTPTQLAETLKTKYAAEIRKPEITVIVRQFAGRNALARNRVFQARQCVRMVPENPAVPVVITGIQAADAPRIFGDIPLASRDQVGAVFRTIDFKHTFFCATLRTNQRVLCRAVPFCFSEIAQTAFHIVSLQ